MSVRYNFNIILLVIAGAFLGACQGQPFEDPPITIQSNMYWQEKYLPQEENDFFADNRADRQPPEGTIARGYLEDNSEYHYGLNEDGSFVEDNPVTLSRAFLERGKERYDIYCTPCHGALGDGGVVQDFGMNPMSLQSDLVRTMYTDGQIYSAIRNGVRTMPDYQYQTSVEDRWAIVAYVRALQRSQNATEDDLRRLDIDITDITE
ncbi:MAG: cytochrome c [Balneolales bacterium]